VRILRRGLEAEPKRLPGSRALVTSANGMDGLLSPLS
jgi:hypothetical protein